MPPTLGEVPPQGAERVGEHKKIARRRWRAIFLLSLFTFRFFIPLYFLSPYSPPYTVTFLPLSFAL